MSTETKPLVTVTYKQMVNFLNNAPKYLGEKESERSRLTFALEKLIKKYEPQLKKINEIHDDVREKIQDTRIDFASLDKDDNIIELPTVENNRQVVRYKFKRDKQKQLEAFIAKANRELAEEMEKKTFEVAVHQVPLPENLDSLWLESFTPFVLAPMTEEQEEAWYLAQGAPKEKEKP